MTTTPRERFILGIVVAGLALGAAAALPAWSQDAAKPAAGSRAASADDDRKRLEGRWERTLTDADTDNAPGAAKAVKEVAGNRETVTYLDAKGEPVYATTADFTLELSGRVKLYTYSNLKVTKGKDARGGNAPTGAVSYIYRVDGDLYHEAHGLLVDSPEGSKPVVVMWKRAK